MDFEYSLEIMAMALLFLASAITIYIFYKKAKRNFYEKEKAATDQLNEMEKQNKFIKNLTSLYDSLVEYDKNKTEFFSNTVHELKTPISVILGAIQLIESKRQGTICSDDLKRQGVAFNDDLIRQSANDGNSGTRNYDIIKLNCYRLLRLANNLLDFVRMESGYLKLNPTDCNIVYLIEEIAQSVVPYARQKQVDLVFDTRDEEIITAVDIEKMERIILNLLSNAIKFTAPGGKITVNTCIREDRVHISVKDTGIGIPKDKQEEIFERFRQVGSEAAKINEGSGIGLSIVKSFVELHQGGISITSEQDKGSEFTVDLPLKRLGEVEKKDFAAVDRHGNILEAINIEFSDNRSIAS